MFTWDLPRRYLKLTLLKGKAPGEEATVEDRTISDLDASYNISFSTSASVSGSLTELDLDIIGLARPRYGFLATNFSPWTKNLIRNEVILEAGYTGKNTYPAVIFRGVITDVRPNLDTADYSIHLKCISAFTSLNDSFRTVTVKGEKKVSEIINEVKNAFPEMKALSVGGSLDPEPVITDYNYRDAPFQAHLRYISQISGIDCYVEDEKIKIKDRSGPFNDKGSKNPLIIDSRTMIGSPIPTATGAKVSVRMDPSIKTGRMVKIVSGKMPVLNSNEYVIQMISHRGETYGNIWQTSLELVLNGLQKQNETE